LAIWKTSGNKKFYGEFAKMPYPTRIEMHKKMNTVINTEKPQKLSYVKAFKTKNAYYFISDNGKHAITFLIMNNPTPRIKFRTCYPLISEE
jgi:hypothetical protein